MTGFWQYFWHFWQTPRAVNYAESSSLKRDALIRPVESTVWKGHLLKKLDEVLAVIETSRWNWKNPLLVDTSSRQVSPSKLDETKNWKLAMKRGIIVLNSKTSKFTGKRIRRSDAVCYHSASIECDIQWISIQCGIHRVSPSAFENKEALSWGYKPAMSCISDASRLHILTMERRASEKPASKAVWIESFNSKRLRSSSECW